MGSDMSDYGILQGFIKDHLTIARTTISGARLSGKSKFYVTGIQMLTIEVNGKYSQTSFIDGEELGLNSVYVGKKGDVIFIFSAKERSDTRVEIKMKDARFKVKGFENFIVNSFYDKAKEYLEHEKEIEEKKELEKKQEIQRQIDEKQAARAAKYANKPYGAW